MLGRTLWTPGLFHPTGGQVWAGASQRLLAEHLNLACLLVIFPLLAMLAIAVSNFGMQDGKLHPATQFFSASSESLGKNTSIIAENMRG